MWYFSGEQPPGYVTSARLSSTAAGEVIWSVSPSSRLTLSDSTDRAPMVTAVEPSRGLGDVSISCVVFESASAVARATVSLTIRTPAALVPLRDDRLPSLVYGYESHICYRIVDQFGETLPTQVPINEQFTSKQVADYDGMNWRRGPDMGVRVHPAYWYDRIGGEVIFNFPNPFPTWPSGKDASTKVSHWSGDWRVGSLRVGRGKLVRSGVVWKKSRGFAEHG